MDVSHHWFHHKHFIFLLFLLFINILLVDFLVARNLYGDTTPPGVTSETDGTVDTKSCSAGCLTAINDAVSPLKMTPPPAGEPTSQMKNVQVVQPTEIPSQQTTLSQTENSVKEYFIPLGTGSSSSSDWTDLAGVKAEIDKTKYGRIQKVLFEASVHVPNANQIVEIRLYNETDKYTVGNSEFLYPSGTTQNFRIAEIQLGQGAKTYKVQIKTQLQYTAVLDQARVHITTY